jgi:lipid-binding SYLF domain-containing protein
LKLLTLPSRFGRAVAVGQFNANGIDNFRGHVNFRAGPNVEVLRSVGAFDLFETLQSGLILSPRADMVPPLVRPGNGPFGLSSPANFTTSFNRPRKTEKTVKTRISLFALASLILLALSASPVVAGNKETAIVEESSEVVDALAAIPLKGIPPALLKDAQGVAIFPGVIKASFIIGGRYGRGVFLVREMGNSWGPPLFLTITGGSLGFQAGAQSTDLILLFKTKPSVERILKGKDKITLGADLAVAAGPVGRQAEAATDVQLRAEIYSYSRTRGLFAGLALEGAGLHVDSAATEAYSRSLNVMVLDPRTGKMVPLPPPDLPLRMKLSSLSAADVAPTTVPSTPAVRPPIQPPPPPLDPPPPIPRQS